MIMEIQKINIIGCMDNTKDRTFESANRIYGVDGLSPTIPTCSGGGIQPKVMEIQNYDDYNSRIRTDQTTMTTLTSNCGSSSTRNGVKIIESVNVSALRMVRTEEGKRLRKAYEAGEVHHGYNEHREAEPRLDGVCNTITTVQKDNFLLEIRLANEIPERFHKFIYEINEELYLIRIRKLTPRECWRLMGFSDNDFDKAASVNSNTQLYKQAGNSIVKQVLMKVFSQMIPTQSRVSSLQKKALALLDL